MKRILFKRHFFDRPGAVGAKFPALRLSRYMIGFNAAVDGKSAHLQGGVSLADADPGAEHRILRCLPGKTGGSTAGILRNKSLLFDLIENTLFFYSGTDFPEDFSVRFRCIDEKWQVF